MTYALSGLESRLIRIEVEARRGPAAFGILGLSDASARETRIRVRAALQRLNVDVSEHAITVKLEPLERPKSGCAFDLPIAVALLAALGELPAENLIGIAFLGELSLTGAVRPVRGVLPTLLGARRAGVRRAIVPEANAHEASFVGEMCVRSTGHLSELVEHLARGGPLTQVGDPQWTIADEDRGGLDLMDVRGLYSAKRSLEIAAAGAHNMIIVGQPGTGKTMLARRLTTILPPLTRAETLEVTSVHSVAGLLSAPDGVLRTRPFRAPHHTVSVAGLVGGGDPLRPGEVSLAHLGCLFLDELLEFRRSAVEALCESVEKGRVTLARANLRGSFPARPLVVAAIHPCPCGFAGSPSKPALCSCSPERVRAYRLKLPRPLLDRIDLDLVLPPVSVTDVTSAAPGDASATVRARVVTARALQAARYEAGEVAAMTNSQLGEADIERVAKPDADGARILDAALTRLGLGACACRKILRVARTIADLDDSSSVRAMHIAEALGSRVLDRASPPDASNEGAA